MEDAPPATADPADRVAKGATLRTALLYVYYGVGP